MKGWVSLACVERLRTSVESLHGDQEVFMQSLSHKVVLVPMLSLLFLVNTVPLPFHYLELGYNVHVQRVHQWYLVNFIITIMHILHSRPMILVC